MTQLTPNEPKYFELNEYLDKIKLTDNVLYRVAEINETFEEYLKLLGKYMDYNYLTMLFYWLDDTQKELNSSGKMERHKFSFTNEELLSGNLFFDSLNISQKRIKDIHKFVCEHSETNENILVGEYRKNIAWRGTVLKNGETEVYWWGANPEDIEKFVKSYIEFYKKNSIKEIYSNPFLKASLAHLLLLRIHPFGDGNSRTSRIIQNLSFTSGINRVYNTKLKLSPLNISTNIYVNQITYADRVNNIKFDIEHFDNEAINRWFNFILNMYGEQLYFQMNRIPSLTKSFERINEMYSDIDNDIILKEQTQKSKINKLFD